MAVKILAALLILLNILDFGQSLDCENTEACTTAFDSPYVDCVERKCVCQEFFGLSQRLNDNRCLKGASLGNPCEQTVQCQIILGSQSRCHPTGKVCECQSAEDAMALFEGKCYIVKDNGEPCTSDYQCMLDVNGTITNPLGRCIDDVCGCYSDDIIPSHYMDGICMVHCKGCTEVNISLLAIMVAGSALLILFVYVMYRIGSKDNTNIVQRHVMKPSTTQASGHP